MDKLQALIKKLFQSRAVVHGLFCFVFITLFFVPALSNKNFPGVISRVTIVSLFFLGAVYAGRWSCKQWLLKNKVLLFIVIIFILTILLSALISLYITLSGLQKQWEALSIGTPLVILFLGLGVFLAISRETLRRQMKDAEIADQQKQSELELLRSQLSPHFLFNTLNNLYGLSITQHEKIPALIVKLSDLLRYSVYNTKQRFVPLNDEIAYIWNYIELERIRMADRLLLHMNIEQSISSSVSISPMILIVFVENAFKHAKNSYEDSIRIDIMLRLSDDKIKFSVSNNCDYDEWLRQQLKKKPGIGIANTIRRLDLLYPNEYELKYRMEHNTYYLDLELNVK